MRQCFDLSNEEVKYLSKLKVALQRVNRKLCQSTMKTHQRFPQKGLRSLLIVVTGDPI